MNGVGNGVGGLRLSEILAAHSECESSTELPDVAGDGYLYRHHSAYRNLRDTGRAFGIRYLRGDPLDYVSFPHGTLAEAQAKGTLHYLGNVSALHRLEAKCPGRFRTLHLAGFRRLFFLHETAHLIAYRVFEMGRMSPEAAEDVPRIVLATLAGEAFATTCEKLWLAQVRGPLERQFYDWSANSYMGTGEADFMARLPELTARVGDEGVFKLLFVSFLFANFLHDELPEGGLEAWSDLAGVPLPGSPSTRAELREFANLNFVISRGFRVDTSFLHFSLLGLRGKTEDLVRFDFLARLRSDPAFVGKLDLFCRIFAEGIAAPEVRRAAASAT